MLMLEGGRVKKKWLLAVLLQLDFLSFSSKNKFFIWTRPDLRMSFGGSGCVGGPPQLVTCPFDSSHQILPRRLTYHIVSFIQGQ